MLILTSCEAKQGINPDGLISAHLPVTNKFTLISPLGQTYFENETITLEVSFPFDMIIDETSGSPRLRLMVGSTVQYATYVPQADAGRIFFEYTVMNGDQDLDGIDVEALELNGSIIQFDNNGVLTNCYVSSISKVNIPLLKISL